MILIIVECDITSIYNFDEKFTKNKKRLTD